MSNAAKLEALAADRFAEAQPRQLIVTIYALYARDEHNWLSIASVVRLMGDLGLDGQAVRSSISRLKQRDTLRSVRVGGVAGYVLSPATIEALREGDRRIFDRRRASLAQGWVLVVFSVPESERENRHELRARLTRLGFGTVSPGVWIAPGTLAGEVHDVLARLGLADYVDIFVGQHLGYEDLVDRVRRWWDLDDLSTRYRHFIERYGPLAKTVKRTEPTEAEAFAGYIRMLTAWRALPYLDPGLPLEVLPANWSGVTAAALFAELDEALRPLARQHAMLAIHG
ncbi:MAG TPA: PaaX family transcriptional regulator C-terminal domain-containing protein [Mycobacteriales bacterium]|nr:PaaX family transcriptional regulator C-terminal domain-containing protein [Mycobacteriales bacterium]